MCIGSIQFEGPNRRTRQWDEKLSFSSYSGTFVLLYFWILKSVVLIVSDCSTSTTIPPLSLISKTAYRWYSMGLLELQKHKAIPMFYLRYLHAYYWCYFSVDAQYNYLIAWWCDRQ